MYQLLNNLPVAEGTTVIILWGVGIFAAIMFLTTALRLISLYSALPSVRAQHFVREATTRTEQDEEAIVLHEVEEVQQPGKPKLPLIIYTIPDEAQDLLAKISVKPSRENGWQVTAIAE